MKKIMLLILMATPLLTIAGDLGTALKPDTLRAEPYADAKNTGTLNKGDSLEIIAKKGAWLQVKTKKNIGWVRLLSVKRGKATSGNSVNDVLSVANGRAGTGKVVSTTGIRGLSAEELKSAKFNETEIKKMENTTITTADAEKFAKVGSLSKTSFPYFKGAK